MKAVLRFIKNYKGLLIAAGVFIAINISFLFVSAERIVELIGVENTYLTLFVIAAVGGLNTFTSGVLYASIVAFASGGADPWLLGIAGGLGIAVGDTIMFHLFKYTTMSLPQESKQIFERYRSKIENWPSWVQYSVIYLYLGFSPFPNDILMFALAVLGFRFLKILPLLILGGVTIATAVSFLGESWPF